MRSVNRFTINYLEDSQLPEKFYFIHTDMRPAPAQVTLRQPHVFSSRNNQQN